MRDVDGFLDYVVTELSTTHGIGINSCISDFGLNPKCGRDLAIYEFIVKANFASYSARDFYLFSRSVKQALKNDVLSEKEVLNAIAEYKRRNTKTA